MSRSRTWKTSPRLGIALAMLLLGGAAVTAPAAHATTALFDLNAPGPQVSDPDRSTVELGVRFEVDAPYSATGIAFYRAPGSPIAGARVHLWQDHRVVASGRAAPAAAAGWVRVSFDGGSRTLDAGTRYVASYTSEGGDYAATTNYFTEELAPPGSGLRTPVDAGVYRYHGDEDEPSQPTAVWEHANYWVTPFGEPAALPPLGAGPWALFDAGTPIVNQASNETATVEVGVRFRVATPAVGDYKVARVRFYRSPAFGLVENRVFVYDAGGAVVGRGEAIGEGPRSGVVDVDLRSSVTLVPGATYTASYEATGGRYAYNRGGLSRGAQAGPITFPANAGVRRSGSGFPTQTSWGTDYYVSPVVSLDPGPPPPPPPPPVDPTIPTVEIRSPSKGENVRADSTIFVRALLTDAGGVLESATVLVDGEVRETFANPANGSLINAPVTLSPGFHTIVVRAQDPAGNVGEALVGVNAIETS